MDDRSGDAHDEELLALLRGVSNKSASASRFDNAEDTTATPPATLNQNEATPNKAPSPVSPRKVSIANNVKNQKSDKPLPPWKRRGNAGAKVASPPPVVVQAPPQAPPPIKKDPVMPPSTFTGERGGEAHDEELLALLRGVSNKTASSSRFDDAPVDEAPPENNQTMEPIESRQVLQEPKVDDSVAKRPLPPWKTKRRPQAKQTEDVVVIEPASTNVVTTKETTSKPAEPSLPPWKVNRPPAATTQSEIGAPQYGIKSDIPSTFSGERGGAAEDAELLALLRGVSKQSGAGRFDDEDATPDESTNNKTIDPVSQQQARPPPEPTVKVDPGVQSESARDQTIKVRSDHGTRDGIDQAGPRGSTPTETKNRFLPWKRNKAKPSPVSSVGEDSEPPVDHFGEEVDIPQSFGMENETPSTFSGERGGAAEDPELLALLRGVSKASSTTRYNEDNSSQQEAAPSTETAPLPPWKKDKPRKILAPPTHVKAAQVEQQPLGIKSDIPSTFSGERGGVAEDAELLALLRGVSKASSSQRFDEETNTTESEVTRDPLPPKQPQGSNGAAKPPISKQRQEFGIKNPTPSNFQGERGGSAEDPELLALLRGVSGQANSNRFSDAPFDSSVTTESDKASPRKAMEPIKTNQGENSHVGSIDSLPPKPSSNEIQVTEKDLPSALVDKSWKVRCEAFMLLDRVLQSKLSNTNVIQDSSVIMEGLDSSVLSFGLENNASALDKALSFLLSYADHCTKAGDAEHAAKIVLSLFQKNAFSSRPTTLKLATSVTLKLMEVGSEGASSIHSIVEVILDKGIGSKKPKVVQAAADLLLEASLSFGASSLPLATLKAKLPTCIEHSNAKVRDIGLKLVAEICRLLGSKEAFTDVVEAMKPSQVKDLDAMMASQPEATPIRVGLRHSRKKQNSSSKEALAVLEAGGKALEAQRYAARPAIDLLSELRKTDYKQLLEMQKWSQKVAALNKVIECAGEKPYKLVKPTSSRVFAELVSDLRKQLTHTHFAVSSKAMAVLSVLAEGAGDGLYPNMKPLLPLLFQLSKDKKLTKAVMGCLDSLYGNVLSLEHILDPDDGLPTAVDEKKQKNALARSTCLLYLQRCIDRKESAGPRGEITTKAAAAAAVLCAKKLEDSDASVRKSAFQAMISLQHTGDAQINLQVHSVVEGLKSSNPRAYKNLTSIADSSNVKERDSPEKTQGGKATLQDKSVSPTKISRDIPSVRLPPRSKTLSMGTDKPPAGKATVQADQDCTTPPHLEDALVHTSGLQIPDWSIGDEEAGVLDGLKGMFSQMKVLELVLKAIQLQNGCFGETQLIGSLRISILGISTRSRRIQFLAFVPCWLSSKNKRGAFERQT